jgi:hypothetical protein
MLRKYINRKAIDIVWVVMGSLLIACNNPQLTTNEATPTQIVAYGASLSEWEAARQEATAQPELNNGLLANTAAAEAVASTTVTNSGWLTGTENSTRNVVGSEVLYPTVNSDNASSMNTTEAEVEASATIPTSSLQIELTNIEDEAGYLELDWNDLVPADYRPEAIMARYQEELSKFEDGDPEAMTLYIQMQEEFNDAPTNETLNNKPIKLPGFIAPLEYVDGIITEFLLVPYFGACIHVPPPPVNQTVLVRTAEEYGIRFEDSYNPIWVLGVLIAESSTTDLADAGYYIPNAIIEPYTYTP